jgi:hypothetical protein
MVPDEVLSYVRIWHGLGGRSISVDGGERARRVGTVSRTLSFCCDVGGVDILGEEVGVAGVGAKQ